MYKVIQGCAVACALVAIAPVAKADTWQGLMCKSPTALKSVFALHEANPNDSVVDNVNAQNAVNKESCVVARVLEDDGKVVETFTTQELRLDIVEAIVNAVCQDGLCEYADPETWYIAHMHHEGTGA